ncbi:DUF3168 domain-containing protein [Mesorhizobium australicum]|uniref:DUF3168 domain-containing protein n=1 Tax=Mesorhizobium australicum TaxID=536018 RepID=A0ACC6T6D1_9HYPH
MAAPERELVGVATAFLRSCAPLTALVGTSIFFRPQPTLTPPYVSVDDAYTTRVDAQCISGVLVTLNVHVWTDDSHPLPNGGGALQDARAIAFEVSNALHHAALTLPTSTLVTIAHKGTRVFYDTDGTTGHGVVSFEAIVNF